MYRHTQTMKGILRKLTGEVAKLNQHIEIISAISGANGLNLSISTMKNLKHIISRDEQLEKINQKYRDDTVFQEVLGVDVQMTLSPQDFFNRRAHGHRLADIHGMTPELVERIRLYCIVDPDGDESTPGGAN